MKTIINPTGDSGTSDELTDESLTDAISSALGNEDDSSEESEESGEPTEESADESPAEDAAEPDAEGDETSAQTPRRHKLKVDGEEIEVDEEELKRGYSRTQDYTRKTQAIAEKSRALDAEITQSQTVRAKYVEQLGTLEEILTGSLVEPDWNQVRAEQPDQYPTMYAEWQQHLSKVQKVRDERANTIAKMQQDHQKVMAARIEAETAKVREAIPGWKDDAAFSKGAAELVSYGKSVGLSAEEIMTTVDSRALILLHKAMQYDALQKKTALPPKGTPTKNAPTQTPTLRPGKAVPPPSKGAADLKASRARFAKTGRLEDAASLISHLID